MGRSGKDWSAFVEEAIEFIDYKSGLVLDLPSGAGRNSRFLAKRGFKVISADLDSKALKLCQSEANKAGLSAIAPVLLDATRALPFSNGVFDIAIVVHFQLTDLLPKLECALRPRGYLIIETFGGHGENWRALPTCNEIAAKLSRRFQLLRYKERPVRRQPDRVTVRAVAQKN